MKRQRGGIRRVDDSIRNADVVTCGLIDMSVADEIQHRSASAC